MGKVLDAHALKGEIYFFSFSKDISWIEKGMTICLESCRTMKRTDFVIESFRPFKDGALIKFEGVDNRNQSEELKGDLIFIDNQNFVSEPGETIFLREVLNFEVRDEQHNSLGKIIDFNSNSIQDLLVIKNDLFTYEVPFVDDFIVEIQFEDSIIVMNFPLDLMDINRVV
ncbi:MAG: 16S rRNA processing protein RimM [Bdellovibrionaceae bacterium]|nr:16S rRNA processing protein RimM [Pseudobdellovibrionaceae bacterium]